MLVFANCDSGFSRSKGSLFTVQTDDDFCVKTKH